MLRTTRRWPLGVLGFLTLAACSETTLPAGPGTGSASMRLTMSSMTFFGAPGGPASHTQVDSIFSDGGAVSNLTVTGVTYGAGQPGGWLTATLSATTAPAALLLTTSPGALAAGTYTATVYVAAAGAVNKPTITVTLSVSATPLLALDAAVISFNAIVGGSSPAAQVDSVRNAGVGALNGLAVAIISYATGQPMGWLSAYLSSTTAPSALTLTASTGSLAAGVYTATVYVIGSGATNGPQTVTVTFTVIPPPSISLRATNLTFYGAVGAPDPSVQVDSVFNNGAGTLNDLSLGAIAYQGGQPTGWLNASLSGATAPAVVTLSVTTAGLLPGRYTASVPVTASSATNNPQVLTVTFVFSPSSFTAIAAGQAHTCALTATGAAYCWGAGGALGDSVEVQTTVPVPVAGGLTFATVGASGQVSCGLTPAGAAYCWGETAGYRLPGLVSGGLTFASLSVGYLHSCGVTPTAIAYCWGDNSAGELGLGPAADRGHYSASPVVGGLTFAAVSAGVELRTCGVTTSGAAYCWGRDWLGNGTRNNSTVPVAVVGGVSFTAISVGRDHTCALTATGVAYCWGGNYHGEVGNGSYDIELGPVPVAGGLSFAAISAGESYTCALTAAGVAYCWGSNSNGVLGDGTTTPRLRPVAVAGGLTFSMISAGMATFYGGGPHTCGITTDGAAYCWGWNGQGQLGDGTTTTRLVPVRVW